MKPLYSYIYRLFDLYGQKLLNSKLISSTESLLLVKLNHSSLKPCSLFT